MNIKNQFKILLAVSAVAITFPVYSAQIYFGGVTPTDGSVETSGNNNIQWMEADGTHTDQVTNIADPASGFFVETFDVATANPLLPLGYNEATDDGNPYDDDPMIELESGDGCALNSYGALDISAAPDGAGIGAQQGNTGQAAHNNDNTTCFGFTPQLDDNVEATVTIDYAGFLQGAPLGYVGIYYGSIDSYNALSFGNVDNSGVFHAINLTLNGTDIGTRLDGNEILDFKNLQSGNRDSSNVYVNVLFSPDEVFTAFQMINWQSRALEVDNIVVGTAAAIPEPASLALLGLGIAGLGFGGAMRKRKA